MIVFKGKAAYSVSNTPTVKLMSTYYSLKKQKSNLS